MLRPCEGGQRQERGECEKPRSKSTSSRRSMLPRKIQEAYWWFWFALVMTGSLCASVAIAALVLKVWKASLAIFLVGGHGGADGV